MALSAGGCPLGLKAALAGYAIVFALKFAAWWVTGLFALLAETLHTLSDLIISIFLLLADRFSRRPADARYRFGYGRAQHLAALVVATLFISFTSVRLVEEGVVRILRPPLAAYSRLDLAIGVLAVSMAFSLIPIVMLARQRPRGPAARAQLLESLNDELGLLAVLVGTIFVARGAAIADPVASLVVAGFIATNAVGLFWDNARVLMGRAPSPDFFERVKMLAREVPAVKGIHDLRAEYVGPETIHLGIHVEVDPAMTVAEGETVATAVRDAIMAETRVGYCVVHVDPEGAPPEPGEIYF